MPSPREFFASLLDNPNAIDDGVVELFGRLTSEEINGRADNETAEEWQARVDVLRSDIEKTGNGELVQLAARVASVVQKFMAGVNASMARRWPAMPVDLGDPAEPPPLDGGEHPQPPHVVTHHRYGLVEGAPPQVEVHASGPAKAAADAERARPSEGRFA